MAKSKEPAKKEFSLKEIESRLILVAQQQYQALLSNLLSFVAIDRLGENIDENTAFELKADLSGFFMWQNEPQKEAEPIVGDTADAMEAK